MDFDYVQLAVGLGIQGAIAGDEYRARCPLHMDNNPSFSLNIETGLWICHSKCGAGDFFRLVELVLNCSPGEARDWIVSNGRRTSVELISDRLGKLLNQPDSPEYLPADLGWLLRYNMLDNKTMPLWFLNRGFTWDTIFKWQIKYDPIMDAVVIPVFWEGNLVGTVTRNTRDDLPKYQNSPKLPKADILFGVISQGKSGIILVEGLLDAIWLWQNGYNAASILGFMITDSQVMILRGYRYGEITLGLDNDDVGRKGTIEALTRLTKAGWLLPQINIMVWPEGCKDAQDCTPDQLKETYGNRKDFIRDIITR